jgi:hypothetical protein
MDEQLVAYTGIVSAIMPLIVALVVQSHWPKEAKGAVALAASLLAGAGSVFLGNADPSDLGVVIPAILIASQASYQAFWKPTGLVPALETATDGNAVMNRLLTNMAKGKPAESVPQS